MSEQIKYEAVFGDQSLFDGAGTFTGLDVVVHSIASGIKSYARSSDLTPESLRNHPICAMRRIIKTPVWTKADQDAGRLPDVGCVVAYHIAKGKTPTEITTSWRENDELEIMKDLDEGLFSVFNKRTETCSNLVLDCIKPIETEAERQQREEDEWIDAAYDCTYVFGGTAEGEQQRLRKHLKAIRGAMLSGELKMPEVQK